MVAELSILLELPDLKILRSELDETGSYIIWSESTQEGTVCRNCGETTCKYHGQDREITIRHLPILSHPTYIKLRPLRYECESCSEQLGRRVTTTQRVGWYNPKNSLSIAYEIHLLLSLVNSTVQDVSIKEQISYDTVEGLLNHRINRDVDWSKIEKLEVVGIDEIALLKGHKNYVVIVTARDADGQITLLAVLKDRKKETVKEFLASIPPRLRDTIHTVCCDIWESYINAFHETFNQTKMPPGQNSSERTCKIKPPEPVSIVIDRFHVAKLYRKALENARKKEIKRLKAVLSKQEFKRFKNIRWTLRKKPAALETEEQDLLNELFALSPILKEVYDLCHELTAIFDTHYSRAEAMESLKLWRKKVQHSQVSFFDAFLKTLNKHFNHILNYFERRLSCGFVEGLNNKVKVLKRRCYGISKVQTLFQRLFLDLNGFRLFIPTFATTFDPT